MKKILLSLAIIAGMATVITGITTAYFSDTETSTGNTISLGSLDLKVDGVDDPGVYNFDVSAMNPGEEGEHTFELKNTGTIEGYASMEINNLTDDDNGLEEPEVDYGDTTGGPGEGELDEQTMIRAWVDTDCDNEYDAGEDVIFEEYAVDMPMDVNLLNAGHGYVSSNILLGENEFACIAVSYEFEHQTGDINNEAMSDSFVFDILFDLHQEQTCSLPPNGGFEKGDFTDWATVIPPGASANVATSHTSDQGTNYGPVEGSYFALLKTDGPGSLTKASQAVNLTAGMKIKGWAAFDAHDYLPYNDYAQVRILDNIGNEVAKPWYSDVSIVGNYGDGPWTSWEWTAPSAGVYTLELSITNIGDSVVDSYALFDAHIIE